MARLVVVQGILVRHRLSCPSNPPHDIHLSDGGHFENLGLYELVRRHCRFIVVSDCGADPEYKFDDLGNAMRRIREDFGVEIEVDVTPLIPGPEGRAAQHMVVGTVHYDKEFDQGLLFLFKPNLLGEEPDDIQQYRRRNTAFPQEPTSDQFYDEAQWESYRRLGEHAGRSAFRFLERLKERQSRYYVFTEAYWQWYPTPAGLDARMLDQTQRASGFLSRLRESDCRGLIDEMLPEIAALDEPVESYRVVPLLMELTQVMEDAFVALKLEETYTNPLNAGWANLFRRWTESPVYRRWWPVLQPLYSRRFRQFLNDEFRLAEYSPGAPESETKRSVVELTDDIRREDPVWKAFVAHHPNATARRDEQLLLEYSVGSGHLYLGLLTWQSNVSVAVWNVWDLYILRPFRGVNVLAAYVPLLLKYLREGGMSSVEVALDSNSQTAGRTDAGFRAFQADRLRLYIAQGFKLRKRDGQRFLAKTL